MLVFGHSGYFLTQKMEILLYLLNNCFKLKPSISDLPRPQNYDLVGCGPGSVFQIGIQPDWDLIFKTRSSWNRIT